MGIPNLNLPPHNRSSALPACQPSLVCPVISVRLMTCLAANCCTHCTALQRGYETRDPWTWDLIPVGLHIRERATVLSARSREFPNSHPPQPRKRATKKKRLTFLLRQSIQQSLDRSPCSQNPITPITPASPSPCFLPRATKIRWRSDSSIPSRERSQSRPFPRLHSLHRTNNTPSRQSTTRITEFC